MSPGLKSAGKVTGFKGAEDLIILSLAEVKRFKNWEFITSETGKSQSWSQVSFLFILVKKLNRFLEG